MCLNFIRHILRLCHKIFKIKYDCDFQKLQIDSESLPEETNETAEPIDAIEYIALDEAEAMAALGLPTEFGDKRKAKNNRRRTNLPIGKDQFAKLIAPTLKEQYGMQTLESARPIFQEKGFHYDCEADRRNSQDTPDSIELLDAPETIHVQIHSQPPNTQEEDETIFRKPSSDGENSPEQQRLECNAQPLQVETIDETTSEYNSAHSHLDDESEISAPNATKKKPKKKRNTRKSNMDIPEEIRNDANLRRYYVKRRTLFSRYDEGIQMDKEAWYSATPECIARHTAERLRCDAIVDGFCGTGGNAIQFAMTCSHVIAIDIDPHKVAMAKHNASIYGVADQIEFIVGDFLQLAATIKADVVFLSPPWGGPDYKHSAVYDVERDLLPVSASDLFTISSQISANIAMYLPKNSDTKQLVKLAGVGNTCELEKNFLNSRLTALTAYYGGLVKKTDAERE